VTFIVWNSEQGGVQVGSGCANSE